MFHGLLPEPHNSRVLHLLFLCAKWHSLAKLRLHTDHTLHLLEETTTELGVAFREFAEKTCTAFNTRELKRESEARRRRQLQTNKSTEASTSTRRTKKFNLQTYKFHALGDYAATIRRYGTSDSYTTEIVSLLQSYLIAFFILSWRRENSNIVVQKPTSPVQIVKNMSNRWPRSSAVKLEFGVSGRKTSWMQKPAMTTTILLRAQRVTTPLAKMKICHWTCHSSCNDTQEILQFK